MNIAELTATDPDKSKIGIWLNTADSQKGFLIAGGSSEVQFNIIAKRVLGLPD